MNGGVNAFGPGNRANATIGRAVRLVLINVAGAKPGVLDKSTQGHPGKFSFTIAELEEDSPWEPYHVERGFEAAFECRIAGTDLVYFDTVDVLGHFTELWDRSDTFIEFQRSVRVAARDWNGEEPVRRGAI